MNLLREYIRILLEQSQPTRTPLDLSIPSDLAKLHQVFKDAGLELFVVGGAVRDTLLNKTPKDYDLATGAPPDEVIALLSPDPELKIDLTGKSFGVVRVWTPEGNEYEIATFRRDIGKGRRPDAVEFTTIEDDVKRRDLTVNALFYDMDTGEVVDYVGGMEDIESGTIRAVGDPAERFDEDKLRILRAVRFAGRMGSDIDPETREAILANNDLSEISPDRIHDEFVKGIKSAQDVPRFLGLMSDLGLFPQVLPGLSVDPSTGAASNDQVIQLALMLSDNDLNQIKSVLKGEKYSNEEVDSILFLLKFSDIDRESAVGLKKEFKRIRFDSNTLQEFTRSLGVPSQKVVDGFLKFVDAPMPVNPRDLMAQGLKKNELGAAIQSAQKEQYDEMVNELREYVQAVLAEQDCNKSRYWGIGGAGMIFVCQEDHTIFLQKRSAHVTGGAGQWAFPGGGIHPKNARERHYGIPIDEELVLAYDDPVFLETALDEVQEEVGSVPGHRVIDSYVYEDCGFVYKTFIANVSKAEKERWQPCAAGVCSWESSGEGWFTNSEFIQQDLFFGFSPALISKVAMVIGAAAT